MIGNNEMYHAPDESIESWCFLRLETTEKETEQSIEGWEVGFGNSAQLIRTESSTISPVRSEAALLKELTDDVLGEHRHAEHDLHLITPSSSTISLLRTRLLKNEIDATLRGAYHISIEEILDEFFETDSAGGCSLHRGVDSGEHSVEDLWNLLNQLAPLVPRHTLVGERL
ncbi:hypothetical protein [Halorubrum gandharaense]